MLPNSPAITTFARTLKESSPPTQADPHQSKPAGVLTLEYCMVLYVNTSNTTVNATLPNTCQITYKGTTQNSVPWIGEPPAIGQANLLIQPPKKYVIGNPSPQTTGGWTNYTPTWTAASSNPTLGNGTLSGRYQMLGPKTCSVRVQLVIGSTTALGSGAYTFGLPFNVSTSLGSQVGTVLLSQASFAIGIMGITWFTQTFQALTGSPATAIGSATTMTNGQYFIAQAVYETT